MIEADTTELLDGSNLPDFGDPLPFTTRGATISVVPEPGTYVLLLLGGLGLARRHRRTPAARQ